MTDQEWKLLDRFKEPSSWAAIGAGLTWLGVVIPAQTLQAISFAGAAVCVALGIVLREKPAATGEQK